jgi:hypothetical protein
VLTEVLVPWRGGCEHRERAWEWIEARYRGEHPEWRIKRCEALRSSEEGPWVKALALMPAVAASDAEIVIVADADVWCENLRPAVEAVAEGAPWAMPHRAVHRLTEHATAQLLEGTDLWELDEVERAYLGVYGGGAVIARRETLLDVPLDPRFTGWGQEDHSWGLALFSAAGHPFLGKAHLFHLWHPPQPRLSRRYGSPEGRALWLRYGTASRLGPDAMRSLLQEAKDALELDQPPLQRHPPAGVGSD